MLDVFRLRNRGRAGLPGQAAINWFADGYRRRVTGIAHF
jgi:hypothetical protein